MVDGLARHSDLALARPLVVVVLLECWHIVRAVVLASQTLDSIGAAWPPAVSLSSCRADHALLVVQILGTLDSTGLFEHEIDKKERVISGFRVCFFNNCIDIV